MVTPVQMAAPGNVADSQIVRDYGEDASQARQCGGKAPDRCEWLEQNKITIALTRLRQPKSMGMS